MGINVQNARASIRGGPGTKSESMRQMKRTLTGRVTNPAAEVARVRRPMTRALRWRESRKRKWGQADIWSHRHIGVVLQTFRRWARSAGRCVASDLSRSQNCRHGNRSCTGGGASARDHIFHAKERGERAIRRDSRGLHMLVGATAVCWVASVGGTECIGGYTQGGRGSGWALSQAGPGGDTGSKEGMGEGWRGPRGRLGR